MKPLSELSAKFAPEDVEWRIGRTGITAQGKPYATALAYVTNRAIQQRLDDVCGPGNWKNEYREWNVGDKHGVLCGISIKIGEEWICKWDGAPNTDFESIKGGLSDAMKRAAVQWGIGRYLYDVEETFVNLAKERQAGWNYVRIDGQPHYWQTPQLPASALPSSNPQS